MRVAICEGEANAKTPKFLTLFDLSCDLARPVADMECRDFRKEQPYFLFFPITEGDRPYEIISTGYDLNVISTIDKRLQE